MRPSLARALNLFPNLLTLVRDIDRPIYRTSKADTSQKSVLVIPVSLTLYSAVRDLDAYTLDERR